MKIFRPKAEVLEALKDSAVRLRELVADNAVSQSAEGHPKFVRWKRNVDVLLRESFGAASQQLEDFRSVTWSPMVVTDVHGRNGEHAIFVEAAKICAALLASMSDEVSTYGDASAVLAPGEEAPAAVEQVIQLARRFHAAAVSLRSRRGERAAITVVDEYDVQYLLGAYLRLRFTSVQSEEVTTSHAGAASRVDFLLPDEKIVVEAKHTRPTLRAKGIGDELLIDIGRYGNDPRCKTLVFFVYDPEHLIDNPALLETELEQHSTQACTVRVVIAPQA